MEVTVADEQLTVAEWQSIAEIAAAEGVPSRTLYNWARSKTVASKVEGGVTLVRVQDVSAKLRGRSRSAAPVVSPALATSGAAAGIAAGTSAGGTGNGSNPGKAAALDGETEARVFTLIEQGLDPVAIVRQEQLPSSVVLEALRQHRALRDQQIPSGPTVQERLTNIEQILTSFCAKVREIETGCGYMATTEEVRVEVAKIAEALDAVVARLQSAERRINALIYFRCLPTT